MALNIVSQGDTFPNPTADLNNSLVGATVAFRMMRLDGTFFLNQPAVIDDAATGIVHYAWQAGNTNTIGAYRCQFVVTYSGGAVQRFPQDSYLEILVRKAVPAA